ncbi:hypothetical protein RvY_15402-3 [Ramazzottius varieornatus]|uniref:Uncharacterized protein n=1 Tax=Ramazzottius varieornatus TaxID=947166 RepID=A0A1D1VZH6_RAMVA|nr:hypothetical protein RvY_15402-3 [Ramazzottius varieornatus]
MGLSCRKRSSFCLMVRDGHLRSHYDGLLEKYRFGKKVLDEGEEIEELGCGPRPVLNGVPDGISKSSKL